MYWTCQWNLSLAIGHWSSLTAIWPPNPFYDGQTQSRYQWEWNQCKFKIWLYSLGLYLWNSFEEGSPSNLWNSQGQTLSFRKWVGKNLEIWLPNLEIYIKLQNEENTTLTVPTTFKLLSFVHHCMLWLPSYGLWVVSHHCIRSVI